MSGFGYDDNDDIAIKGPDGTIIGNIGDRRAIEPLMRAMDDMSLELMTAAKEAIEKINMRN